MSGRLIKHIVIAVIAWALFGYYWSLVAQRRLTENTVRGVQVLALLVAVIWIVTALWIQHNRRRFAGRPDRRTRRSPAPDPSATDAIGQVLRIETDEATLTAAAYVVIEVDEESGEKVIRAEAVPAGEKAP